MIDTHCMALLHYKLLIPNSNVEVLPVHFTQL